MAPRSSRRLDDAAPFPQLPKLSLVDGTNSEQTPEMENGVLKIEQPDGSVIIVFSPQDVDSAEEKDTFGANLSKRMDDGELASIATELLDGITVDEASRKDWLETRARGINLLGLKLEPPRADAGSTSAPLEGMSTVRHPLLLEATVAFQATTRASLLPAAGPVKVRNDTPPPPVAVSNASQDVADSLEGKDELAQALEKDFNHYLTTVATEYVPDTDRMLFYVGFGGDGFKKVYNCPLRRRPVSESIDAEDLIVSDASTDMQNCPRITHKIAMRKSILRRMQIMGVYRDVELGLPTPPQPNAVDKKKQEIDGRKVEQMRQQDRDYTVYEVYCELDLDKFAPRHFKNKGLPLPYRVTIEKESRQILDIRRNWREEDKECLAKRFFVQFPFIRGLGFYGLGYIHLLGNTANALTAAWREALDLGMFNNFPGFIYNKGVGRQNTTTIRVGPGQGHGMDVPPGTSLKDAVMPLPYKELSASFTQFVTHVEEVGQRLASTANIQVGEAKQDAPVGTTLALIEQASKVLDSAHKRLHAAQAEEFMLLKDRFLEDPEAFWRHNRTPTVQWQKEQFVQALTKSDLVPVADPNNPTSLHRAAKALAIKQLQQANPSLYDPVAVDMRVMRIVDIDPAGLFRAQPAQPPPDPRLVAIQQKAEATKVQNQINYIETQIKAQEAAARLKDKQADRESKERLAALQIQLELLKIEEEKIIHSADMAREAATAAHGMQLEAQVQSHKAVLAAAAEQQKMQQQHIKGQQEQKITALKTAMQIGEQQQHHRAEMDRADQSHQQSMQHSQQMHEAKLEQAKQAAKVAAKAAKAKASAPKKSK